MVRRLLSMAGIVIVVLVILAAIGGKSGPATPSADESRLAASPTQAAGSIVFSAQSYSCKAAGQMSFHVVMSQASGALSVSLVTAKIDAGGETAIGGPVSISLTSPDIVSFNDGPIAVSDLCGGLDPGNYVFRIVSVDGKTKLAEGPMTLAP